VHLMQSRIDEAIPWLEKSRSARPEDPSADWFLAAAYGLKGDEQLAHARLAEAIRGDCRRSDKQLARLPTRRELARTALGTTFATMMLTTLSLLFVHSALMRRNLGLVPAPGSPQGRNPSFCSDQSHAEVGRSR